MATPYENAAASYASVTAKIAEVLASPLPNITVDGVSIDRLGYYRMLLDIQKNAREQMLAAQDCFEVFG
jgi:hypothetical protein